MEHIIETLGRFILEFVFIFPGAFIRWAFARVRGKKIDFKTYSADNEFKTIAMSILFYVCLALVINFNR